MRRVLGGAVVAILLACVACSSASTAKTSRSASIASASFVARYDNGAAQLVWSERAGVVDASVELTHPGADPAAGVVHEHLDLQASIVGDTVTFGRGSNPPWTGTVDGEQLVLSWAPDNGSFITTTFTSGGPADYQAAAADVSRQLAAQQQAIASRTGTIAAAEAARQASAQAGRLALAAARRAAHDARVAAMRAAHDAKVAAMQQRQAAARAKAAAHHHP